MINSEDTTVNFFSFSNIVEINIITRTTNGVTKFISVIKLFFICKS